MCLFSCFAFLFRLVNLLLLNLFSFFFYLFPLSLFNCWSQIILYNPIQWFGFLFHTLFTNKDVFNRKKDNNNNKSEFKIQRLKIIITIGNEHNKSVFSSVVLYFKFLFSFNHSLQSLHHMQSVYDFFSFPTVFYAILQ